MPIDDNFTFNGQNSADFGLSMASDPESIHPERRGKSSQIVGRNGVFVREDGSYDTYTQTYDVLLDSHSEGVYARSRKVANWLLGSRGFCRLEDTFEPDVFKLARYAKQLSVENRLTRFGRAQIAFEVQPQRYFLFGECDISISNYNNSATVVVRNIPETVESVKVRAVGTTEFFMRNATNRIDAEMEQQGDYEVGVLQTAGGYNRAQINASLVADNFAEMRFIDADGEEVVVFSINADGVQFVNPTNNAACPIMEFRDLTNEPTPVAQTLTMNDGTFIAKDGEVAKAAWATDENYFTSDPVALSRYAYAIITGTSYSFFNSGGDCIVTYSSTSAMQSRKIAIPNGSASMVVGGIGAHSTVALSLQAARPNPGAAAVTVGSTTVNLDFSEQDTIVIDCDLHDAHYTDGSSANSKVTFSDPFNSYPTFPTLGPGATMVKPGDGANLGFNIRTRWWTL